ncbi:WD_REPEATS_REGION domain-containing protein, partial [Linnemannia elongata]
THSMTKVPPIETIATGDEDDPNNKQQGDLLDNFHGIEINPQIETDAQEILCLEDDLHNLRSQRLRELHQPIYILPMAKANLQAQDDDLFSLKERVQEFLASQRQVMLVLGDSGSGKSAFNRHLEHQLWTDYNQGGSIPLYINLPTVDDPAHNLIEKQLQYLDFSDDRVQEMKQHRQFILICDGYDESQLMTNIHTTNHLNQPGQWRSKTVISCRSQYLGQDYHSQFQPQPSGQVPSTWLNLFQEAVIAPFSKEQIEEYVTHYLEQDYRSQFQPQPGGQVPFTWLNLFQKAVIAPFSRKQIEEYVIHYLEQDYRSQFQPQLGDQDQSPWSNLFQEAFIALFPEKIEEYVTRYVPPEPRPWVTRDYMHMLTTIPNLMDLVKNPFLLILALEALPFIAEGQQDLSTVKVTRVQLYDNFVLRWLGVNKRRLESNTLSLGDRIAFDQLLAAGFISMGIDYAMRLALAIFERQDGNPVVRYSHRCDHDTWKAEFFGADPAARLLQESCPLTRTDNQFLFLHRSMLEYFFSLGVYNPIRTDDDFATQTETPSSTAHAFDPSNPLFLRNLLTEPSIIQFLCDRFKSIPDFEQQLRDVIDLSKTDASVDVAATNAITILVRAGSTFHGADLRNIKIPGADLSGGQFDYTQIQGADLTDVNLSRSWLRNADMIGAQMKGVQFGELPYLEFDDMVQACAYSSHGRILVVGDRV